jgi:hypothetical protein
MENNNENILVSQSSKTSNDDSTVDLRTCKPGDILISKFGLRLEYVKALDESNYYDHEVKYLKEGLGNGTRTHNGWVFRYKRLPSDEDIVEIIRK